LAKVVRVERPFDADELIAQTKKCKKPIELCLKVCGMLQPIASYPPKQFIEHLRNFRRALEAPQWQHEELTLALCINRKGMRSEIMETHETDKTTQSERRRSGISVRATPRVNRKSERA